MYVFHSFCEYHYSETPLIRTPKQHHKVSALSGCHIKRVDLSGKNMSFLVVGTKLSVRYKWVSVISGCS